VCEGDRESVRVLVRECVRVCVIVCLCGVCVHKLERVCECLCASVSECVSAS